MILLLVMCFHSDASQLTLDVVTTNIPPQNELNIYASVLAAAAVVGHSSGMPNATISFIPAAELSLFLLITLYVRTS